MNLSNSDIRSRARQALNNSLFSKEWLLCIAVSLIIGTVIGLASGISYGIGTILLTGPLYVGLHVAFLNIVRFGYIQISDAFEGFQNFGSNLVLGFMHALIIWLWSLLFIIPGIIKGYSYSMAYFVKADHPEYGWRECLNESERLMQGNRFKLFCLNLSFIGWYLVCFFTCGIGSLWVTAYVNTANAVFYQEIKSSKACI